MTAAVLPEPGALRARLAARLKHRFFLRFHVSLILLFTVCVGLVATKALLWLGLETMWLRYLLVMAAAYGGFLLGVRLWLAYVGVAGLPDAPVSTATRERDKKKSDSGGFDLPDLGFGGGGGGGGSIRMPMGGGGDFAGGGASDAFVDAGGGGQGGMFEAVSDLASTSSGSSAGGGGGGGSGGGGFSLDIGDGEGLVVLLLALLVLVAVVGGAFWVVWAGPEILVEAAFEAMLAGGLVKSLKGGATGWVGRVVWKTLLPFLLVTGAALAFAVVGQGAYPEARTFREVVHAAWSGEQGVDSALVGRDIDPEVAQISARLDELGEVDASSKQDLRFSAMRILSERADRLAGLGRLDEMRSDFERAFALVGPSDAPALQEAAADAMRMLGWQLAERGHEDEGFAAYKTLRERFGASRSPELAWRVVWSLNQEAATREQDVEGSGLPLVEQAIAYPVQTGDSTLDKEIAEAFRLRGIFALWRAKKAPAPATSADFSAALADLERALSRAPVNSGERDETLAGLAYARFLKGDTAGAEAALAQVRPQQREWIASVLKDYTESRPISADAAFRTFYESRLKT